MKKIFVFAFSVVGFMLITGEHLKKDEVFAVLLNGKPFANAFYINGAPAMKLADFLKAAGIVTLEPSFTLNDGTLAARAAVSSGGDLKVREAAVTPGAANQYTIKLRPGALFRVRKAGIVSSHVFTYEGTKYVPMTDVANAFGFIIHYSNIRPGAAINMNPAPNSDAILVGL